MNKNQLITVNSDKQLMYCYNGDRLHKTYSISTGKNGMGEQQDSGCTPRGWHQVHNIIGLDNKENSVFVGRCWTGEIYSDHLSEKYPERDWILTRIIQLDGLEPGRNAGNNVDSLKRFIYIHGTPDTTYLGAPGSKGCIRMRNKDIINLASWVNVNDKICIYP